MINQVSNLRLKNKSIKKNTPKNSPITNNKIENKTKKSIDMTRSYNFSINFALDYTCHRLNGNDKSINFCAKCNSCQIVNQLNNLKQWFDRASHITIRKLLTGLISRINNIKICIYLNDLLKPLTDSKDYVYARNKFIPSCEEDHMKATNNRCLDNDYVNKQINDVWNWFSNSSNYIKINFMLSLLNKCEQAIVFMTILKIKSILETYNPYSESTLSSRNDQNYDSESEMVFDAVDDEDEEYDENFVEDEEVMGILKRDDERKQIDSKYVDFIRLLPVHLSKSILNRLNKKSLYNCLFVCKYWSNLIKEVHREDFLHKILIDDMMLLKGTSSKGINPKYANNVDVKVPNLVPGSYDVIRNHGEPLIKIASKSECNWSNAFSGYSSRNVIMEERNVFCGPYNVLLLKEKRDAHRVAHFNGKNIVAFGSFDKKVRFIDLKSASEKTNTIQGHAGSIKCVHVNENKKIVITGSFDTSIRVWSLENGKCLRIFQGHQQTITCISMYDEHDRVISGSMDKTCKVWNLSRKKCWRTFKHTYPIVAVAINEEICISAGQTGKVKVFNLLTGNLIKTLNAHQGPVNAVKFDRWHILTCGMDGYASVYSTQGKHKNCIVAMRHPKEVLCLEFQYLRAITGSADGKIRIWNILNGDCLRVMRGNSQCDPILSLSIFDNRILLNTEFNIILMEFEIVQYDFTSAITNLDEISETTISNDSKRSSIVKKPRSYSLIRASRSELVATPNVKIFNDERKTILDHSARPISAKNLKDAQIVHSITSKPMNITKNSIGNISELGLQKRQSLVQSINATILTQTSLSAISTNRTTAMSHVNSNQTYFNERKIEKERQNLESELDSFRNKTSDLNETKQYLREQLKEMKQFQQSTPSDKSPDLNRKTQNDSIETKSCIESRLLNRNDLIKKFEEPTSPLFNRPTSSPSKVDTRTKIRLKQDEVNKIKSEVLDKKLHLLMSDDRKVNESKLQMKNNNKNELIISKVFETHEKDLQTSSKMHPLNLKSKIPNPKIVNPILIQRCNTETRHIRPKSAFVPKKENTELTPILFRPKTNLPKRKPKTDFVIDPSETSNIISSNNELNLMTYKQVDQIMNTLNGCLINPDKVKEAEREDFCKRIWTMKSQGKYHGSLLAKPKAIAPEIRE